MLVPDTQGRVHVLSLNTFDIRTFYTGQPEEDVTSALSPDGTLLATVSKTGTVRVWHVGLAEVLLETRLSWRTSASDLTGIRFSADGKRLIVEPKFEQLSVLALSTDGEAAMAQSRAMLAALPAAATSSAPSAPKYRLGVFTSDVAPALAARYGLSAGEGALIVEVLVPSPALEAGLRIGDVILSLGGSAVRGHAALPEIVRRAPATKDVEVAFVRDGRRRTTRVRFGGP
jgi:membrane-associated protease RseP (regulator of RpoE activity)